MAWKPTVLSKNLWNLGLSPRGADNEGNAARFPFHCNVGARPIHQLNVKQRDGWRPDAQRSQGLGARGAEVGIGVTGSDKRVLEIKRYAEFFLNN